MMSGGCRNRVLKKQGCLLFTAAMSESLPAASPVTRTIQQHRYLYHSCSQRSTISANTGELFLTGDKYPSSHNSNDSTKITWGK